MRARRAFLRGTRGLCTYSSSCNNFSKESHYQTTFKTPQSSSLQHMIRLPWMLKVMLGITYNPYKKKKRGFERGYSRLNVSLTIRYMWKPHDACETHTHRSARSSANTFMSKFVSKTYVYIGKHRPFQLKRSIEKCNQK